jgi:protein gp37
VFHNIYLGTSWMTEVDDYRLDPMYNLHHRRWNTWISIEPIVGPPSDKLLGNIRHGTFKWVVLGCESGAGARRMDYEWALSIREACIDGRTSFFYKQGPGSSDDGRTHEEVVFGHKTIDVPLLDGRSWTQAPWRS